MAKQADLLLVTATEVENKAIIQVVKEKTQHAIISVPISNRTYFDLGIINNTKVFLTQTEMGSGGIGASQQSIQKGIQALSPTAVILVGIAFGMNQEKQSIGDILVSRQLLLYETQRIGTSGDEKKIIYRGDRPHASQNLINFFRGACNYWTKTKVHFGLLLTGEKLVDNLNFRQELQRLEPEAIGGDMEAAGLYTACSDAKVDWIVVKSICDWGDGHKAENKAKRQRLAARNAASFLIHALQYTSLIAEEIRTANTGDKLQIQSGLDTAYAEKGGTAAQVSGQAKVSITNRIKQSNDQDDNQPRPSDISIRSQGSTTAASGGLAVQASDDADVNIDA